MNLPDRIELLLEYKKAIQITAAMEQMVVATRPPNEDETTNWHRKWSDAAIYENELHQKILKAMSWDVKGTQKWNNYF